MNTRIWQEYSSWRLRRIGRKKDVSRLLTLVMGEGGVTRDLSVSHSWLFKTMLKFMVMILIRIVRLYRQPVTYLSRAGPEFLDRGFKLAEGGGVVDLCSLTNFSWNSPWKWNNFGSRRGSFEPPEPPLDPPLPLYYTPYMYILILSYNEINHIVNI